MIASGLGDGLNLTGNDSKRRAVNLACSAS